MKLAVKKGIFSACYLGSLVCAVTGCNSATKNSTGKNQTGRSDFNYIFKSNLDSKDFVVLNVGDHDSLGTLLQDKKIKFCNENNISLGVVISSDASTEEDIYNDVEYVKGLIRDYKINFPVYLNIDHIIMNDSLNVEMKSKIIKDFLEKCSANHIYVGVNGTDTNLCRAKEYCDITGYDAYVIQDSEEIHYDGNYCLYKDLDGVIHAKENLAKSIKKNKLNRKGRFLSDKSYEILEGESITDVALKFGMSVDDILGFNNMSKSDIEPGVTIIIPSKVTSKNNTTYTFNKLDEPIRGCDISHHQGKSCKWDILAENFEYIILKCSQGTKKDECFENYSKNCEAYNIPMGVYCFNNYMNSECKSFDDFVKKQNKQADYTISLLKDKKVDYPVYFDIEKIDKLSPEKDLTKEQVKTMLDIWFKKIGKAGYIPGVYCNKSTFNYLQKCVNYKLSDKFQVWIAGGNQYGSGPFELDEVVPSNSILNSSELGATMGQSTDMCVGAGAGNGSGYLDIDFSTVDYTSGVVLDENFEIKDFNRFDLRVPLILGSIGVVGAGGIVLGNKIRKKNKQKRKA